MWDESAEATTGRKKIKPRPTFVGNLDGKRVGFAFVGNRVGKRVGDGYFVGTAGDGNCVDGKEVGYLDGRRVGKTLGTVTGNFVGFVFVGYLVGAFDGNEVG